MRRSNTSRSTKRGSPPGSGRNLGSRSMPFGFGHHPYYPKPPGTRLSARVRAMWEIDADVLPVTLSEHPAVDALEGGLIVDDFDLDNNFSGWRREALIEWPDQGRRFTLRAGTPLDFSCSPPLRACRGFSPSRSATRRTRRPPRLGGTALALGESVEALLSWTPGRLQDGRQRALTSPAADECLPAAHHSRPTGNYSANRWPTGRAGRWARPAVRPPAGCRASGIHCRAARSASAPGCSAASADHRSANALRAGSPATTATVKASAPTRAVENNVRFFTSISFRPAFGPVRPGKVQLQHAATRHASSKIRASRQRGCTQESPRYRASL